jgi:hypothetical protein
MDNTTKELLKNFCKDAFTIIKTINPKIKKIVIKYFDGDIYFGDRKYKSFIASYYNPKPQLEHESDFESEQKNSEQLANLLSLNDNFNKKLLDNIFNLVLNEINELNDKISKSVKSYLIYYDAQTDKVKVCKNKIGALRIDSTLLFSEF